MRVKQLKIVGFKSFFDSTEVVFHRGLNAIVGPNGCGKSNISDAIKWVMGEQNVRNLRGDRLEDIIFGGSRENKPLGMAEVTMTLESIGGGLPAHLQEFAEVEVTRRAFRSGESEYYINKKPCLLKDIREIFMDTGLNPRAYAIIEQGSVMDIINSSPQELRRLLEEAAGVTKYRERKAASQRKMEATRENLSRVNDIVLEVDRHLRAARRQANEAQRYVVFQRESSRMEGALYRLAYREMDERRLEAEARRVKLAETADGARSGIVAAEASEEEMRLRLTAMEGGLTLAQENFYKSSGRLELAENRIRHLNERLADHRQSRERSESDRGALELRRKEAEGQRTATAAALEEARAALLSLEPALEERRREERRIEAAVVGHRSALDRSRSDVNRLHADKRETLAAISTLEARLEGDEQFLTQYQAESQGLAQRETQLAAERETLRLAVEQAAAGQAAIVASLRETDAVVAARENKEREVAAELQRDVRRLTETEGRLEYVTEVQRQGKNLAEGSRNLLGLAAEKSRKGALAGVLGHLVKVDKRYRPAIEAVMAERLETVLVKSGSALAELLEAAAAGSASGAVLGILDRVPAPGAEGRPVAGTLGPAWKHVKGDAAVLSVVRALLADVHLVDDRATALKLTAKGPLKVTLCTLTGDLFHPWGGITLGGAAPAAQGVLELAEEIETLQGSVEELKRSISGREEALAALRAQLAEARTRRHQLEGERRALENVHGQQRAELQRLEGNLEQHSKRRQSVEADLVRRREGRERDLARLQETRDKLAGLEAADAELSAAAVRLEEQLRSADAQREEVRLGLSEMEVARAAAAEQVRALESALARMERDGADVARQLGTLGQNREELAARISEAEAALQAEEQSLDELRGSSVDASRVVEEAQAAYRLLAAEQAASSDRLKALRHDADRLVRELSGVEVTLAEITTRMEETAARALAETGHAVSGEEPPAELSAYLGQPVEELRARVIRLKTRMAKIGPVNMAALDEVTGLQERYTFLTTQKEDLEKALEGLQEAIRKINRTSRERFAETYELVAAKFAETFRVLFNGGEAELRLEEITPEAPDPGLVIYAQPPGKKMSKLNLLSGGEKAMTALALVFALFSVRPAPFCLMDEVDAPLDDVNIGRFLKLLGATMTDSQIVLITHSKQTMEVADNLVGVTMESPGVSKLVTVRLDAACAN